MGDTCEGLCDTRHTCHPGSHTWRSTLQNPGAIFKIHQSSRTYKRLLLWPTVNSSFTPREGVPPKSAHDCGVVLEKIQRIFIHYTPSKQQQQQQQQNLRKLYPTPRVLGNLEGLGFFRKQAIPEEMREETVWMSLTHKPVNHHTCGHPRTSRLKRLRGGSHKNKSSLSKAWPHSRGQSGQASRRVWL